MIDLFDTHCHIHEAAGNDDVAQRWHDAGIYKPEEILQRAQEAGITRLICVGCTLSDSKLAADFASQHQNVWASIGIHPHEAKSFRHQEDLQAFAVLAKTPKVVAIGECGLDYFYNHSSKEDQQRVLRYQIELALEHGLPLIFHVRDAFSDFWPIFDSYKGVRGVIHSFSSDAADLDQIVSRGLYVGLNGIMTFTKQAKQLEAAKAVPIDRLLLETDAPFLTPQPFRGTICEPRHVQVTADFLANLRRQSLEALSAATTKNARDLFCL